MPAKEDHEAARGMAEWLGLKEEEAENFVKEAMTRRGHKPVMQWADSDEGGDNKGGGFFGGGGNKGANWQYGGQK